MDNITLPRVLVVSNNPFSDSNCNGKTLASFFAGWDKKCLANLFYSELPPLWDACSKFYRLSDRDMLHGQPGEVIETKESAPIQEAPAASWKHQLKEWQSVRLARECIWRKKKWCNSSLLTWLDAFSPQIVFFMGGDSVFSYRISLFIAERYKCRYVFYITDDYVLPKLSLSPAYWMRLDLIRKYFMRAIKTQDLFFTIGEKMQRTYLQLFGYPSVPLSHISDDKSHMRPEKNIKDKSPLVLTYAGSFSFNRDKTLHLIALACHQINQKYKQNLLRVDIYSQSKPSCMLNYGDSSRFHGFAEPDKLKDILSDSDVLIFVESFQYSSIKSCSLSLSTKASEYTSYKKCILNVGPLESATVEYLDGCSISCHSPKLKTIRDIIEKKITNQSIRRHCANAAYSVYCENHAPHRLHEQFRNLICNLTFEGGQDGTV